MIPREQAPGTPDRKEPSARALGYDTFREDRQDDDEQPEKDGIALRGQPNRKAIHKGFSVEAAELITCNPVASPVLCETYIFDPDAEEDTLGSLYIVLETINISEKAPEVLESVSTGLRREYYRDPERSMLESLESALDQANHVLGELAEQGEPDWVDAFHASICAFRGNTLHISRVGKAELLLARKGHLTDIGLGLSDPRTRRPLHAFTSVASGSVAENDILLLSTPQLLHLLPRDRLNQLLTGKSPSQTVSLLRSLLDDSREDTAFATLLLRFVKSPERLPAPEVPVSLPRRAAITPQSVEQERPSVRPRRPITMRPSLVSKLIRIIGRGAALLWTTAKAKIFPAVASSAQWSARTGSRAAAGASQKLRGAVQTWRARDTDQPPTLPGKTSFGKEGTMVSRNFLSVIPRRVAQTVSSFPTVGRSGFRSLPRSARIFLVLTVILAILFAGSLVALSRKREEDAAIRAALERLQEAQAKKQGADAALIYDNTDQARQLLRESRAAAEKVAETEYYKDDVTQLLASINEVEDRIERVTRVQEPNIVGDFAGVAPSLNTPGMAAIGNAIYTFDPANNAIFRLNAENGETSVVSQTSQGVGYFRAALPLAAEKMILFSTDSPGLALFDAERGDLLKQEITFPEGVSEIKAIGTFGSRLYILSPQKKMVYGYSKTLAGYEGGTPWLKDEKVAADRAVAMGIDGYIYLLMSDGQIVKLLKGAPVDFKQTPLATPMNNPTRLLINEELKHLYVLDPAQKRVVVYDTTGGLSRQFVFPNAKELKDIAIGGKEETLFVLDQTQVYSVPLK